MVSIKPRPSLPPPPGPPPKDRSPGSHSIEDYVGSKVVLEAFEDIKISSLYGDSKDVSLLFAASCVVSMSSELHQILA